MAGNKPETHDHDFASTIVTVTRQKTGKSFEITGTAKEGFKITRNSPKYLPGKMSGDGKAFTRSTSNDRSGKMTIAVDQHAASTRELAALDLEDPENDKVDISVTDRAGKMLYELHDAWLSKFATDLEFGREGKDWGHEFETAYITSGKEIDG